MAGKKKPAPRHPTKPMKRLKKKKEPRQAPTIIDITEKELLSEIRGDNARSKTDLKDFKSADFSLDHSSPVDSDENQKRWFKKWTREYKFTAESATAIEEIPSAFRPRVRAVFGGKAHWGFKTKEQRDHFVKDFGGKAT